MRRRPPTSTLDRSSAASDVYKRQGQITGARTAHREGVGTRDQRAAAHTIDRAHAREGHRVGGQITGTRTAHREGVGTRDQRAAAHSINRAPVSYTHLTLPTSDL